MEKKRILIVEDEGIVALKIKDSIEQRGHAADLLGLQESEG